MKPYFVGLLILIACFDLFSQKKKTAPSLEIDDKFFSGMKYRSVGPTRGGRSTAVAGIPEKPFTFFMGTTGGGVWKTDDAGTTWNNVSDGQIDAGSMGAIAVATSDPNVIFAGTGSACARGNVSAGVGVYKSIDEGNTWSFSGLKNAGQIADIIIHPKNPDIIYVAALGNIFGSNEERGVFRSKDGGASWTKVLFISNGTGVVDLSIDAKNPRILYAAAWRGERKPWTMIDGGVEGGVYKTTNGGDDWEKLEGGLPTGELGRIAVEASPAKSGRVWALIVTDSEDTKGLYRSDDYGKSWKHLTNNHNLLQRGWYYTHLTADPQDENTVYCNNVRFWKSVDGGNDFERISTPHGDNHGMWINPNNSDIMIQCNDGGSNVSVNGGITWSTLLNQPTSEFYRVTVDNQFPYRLYAGQQDNTTISVPSQYLPSVSDTEQWFNVGGGESGDVAIHPDDPNIIYSGTYSGEITYVNRNTGQRLQMTAYPHYTEGTEQRDLKYRWQWNFPIFVSRHNTSELYMGSNVVHRSNNNGQTWEVISPDLTQALDKYHDIPGGPIQHDGTGVEIYSTVFALEESPHNAGEIWAGSDDGLIHITRDGGQNWKNITPSGMPSEGTVNKIEVSAHEPGRAFAAVYRYRDNDFKPYIFRTNNYGESWNLITDNNGIPTNHFVRTIAEDPDRKGLLYAGTEFGLYVSFNDGTSWQSFQLNMPVVPITDMEVHNQDLVLSTQGRAFWILDDLSPLHRLNTELMAKGKFLYKPRATYRTNVGGWDGLPLKINFYLNAVPDSLQLIIKDANGIIVRQWSTNPVEGKNQLKLEAMEGFNQISWDLTYPPSNLVEDFVAMDFSADNAPGPIAVPGDYTVELTSGDWSDIKSTTIKADPRWTEITTADYQKKFDLEKEVIELLNESQDVVRNIRSIREQTAGIIERSGGHEKHAELKNFTDEFNNKLTELEGRLVQNKIKVTQDEINYRRVFTNHLVRLFRVIVDEHNAPTGGMLERWEDLQSQYSTIRQDYDALIDNDLQTFNSKIEEMALDAVLIKE
ncbi:MAG: glycosyl hydrolase [Cyclobacteriaceae bacterium]